MARAINLIVLNAIYNYHFRMGCLVNVFYANSQNLYGEKKVKRLFFFSRSVMHASLAALNFSYS